MNANNNTSTPATYAHDHSFTMDNIAYSTDFETIALLRRIVPDALHSKDNSAVAAVMALGLKVGRIIPQSAERAQ